MWTSFIDAVEEEFADAFLTAHDAAGSFRGWSQGQKLVWRSCKSPCCNKFPRGSHEMQSWSRKSRIGKHILTARQRLDELLLGDGQIDHTRTLGLVHPLLVLARQAHKLAAVPMSLVQCARRQTFWKLRLRTIAAQPAWMIQLVEAEATDLADQALRVQQQAARRSWRARLEKNTTGGASKVHQLIRQPIGFQAARGNVVDEQLKLRGAWAANLASEHSGPSADLTRGRRAFVPPTNDGRDAQDPRVFSCGHQTGI